MKPKNKADSWCYTLKKRVARKKAKRLKNKRNRKTKEED
jgi:hypothetical protein